MGGTTPWWECFRADLGFEPLDGTELWAPLAFDSQDLASRGSKWIRVVARLRPRVSLEKARAEMDLISARLEKLYPNENSGWRVDISPSVTGNGKDGFQRIPA